MVDIKTTGVKPLRQGFSHLLARFGDKRPPTRYQEATYDVQPVTNWHYRPLWETDPELELYDARRTAIKMADFHDLKDPRQYYYGAWTMARAKQQNALDQQLDFVGKRGLLGRLPDAAKEQIEFGVVPLRHYEWGANTTNCQVGAYGYQAAIVSAAMFHAMDRLGMAQHLSRIGLFIDGNTGDSLEAAHRYWTDAPEWQGLRRQVENMFVVKDWFEVFVAQNLVADALVYPLFHEHFEARFTAQYGASLSLLTDYMLVWDQETARWVDSVIKTAATESAENQRLLAQWTAKWRAAHTEALQPIAKKLLGEVGAKAAFEDIDERLDKRIAKLGVA